MASSTRSGSSRRRRCGRGGRRALATYYLGAVRRVERAKDSMRGSYLGPSYSDEGCRCSAQINRRSLSAHGRGMLVSEVAKALRERTGGRLVPGRMEFGPGALGARSILGDARSPTMQKMLNSR